MTTSTIPRDVLDEVRAMTLANLDPNMPPCPDWCTLDAGHPWDSVVGTEGSGDLHESRGHQGPYFGQYVAIDGDESALSPGVVTVQIGLMPEVAEGITTSADALQLVADLVSALAWVEARK